MSTTNTELKKEIEELKTMMAAQELTKGNGHLKDHIISRDEMKQYAHEAGQNVRSFFKHKGEQFDTVRADAESRIQERPFASTAIALAGGVVLGALLRGRK